MSEEKAEVKTHTPTGEGTDLFTVDVKDPRWLKTELDPVPQPEHTDLWKNEVRLDGWMMAHDALRTVQREMGLLFHASLQKLKDLHYVAGNDTPTLPSWWVSNLKTLWDTHHHDVHHHHGNEEDIFFPFLNTRFNLPPKMTSDHKSMVDLLEQTNTSMGSFADAKNGAEQVSALEAAQKTYTEMWDLMSPHLREEEQVGLVLQRAFFTPAEVAKQTEVIMKGLTTLDTGGFFRCFTEAHVKEFMAAEGIPFFVWNIQFKGAIETYNKERHSLFIEIMSGKQWADDSWCTIA